MTNAELKIEIDDLKEAINSPSTPEDSKSELRSIVKDLESKLKTTPEKPKAQVKKPKTKAPAKKKSDAVPEAKFRIRSKVTAPVTKGEVATITLLNYNGSEWIYTIEWDGKSYEAGASALTLAKENKTALYDCDDLIEKEKEKAKKRKENADKKAKEPKKTEATKNKEAIEKVSDRVTSNLEKRIDKGEVSKAEIKKLITEAKDLLKMLEKALKTAK
jgi:hypothetical protein